MTKQNNNLDQFASYSGNLFSLPTVAMEVLELTNDETVDVNALKECIENDPALTIKILRVVNSSLFGLTGEVADLNQALALLGCKPLKLLVLGFSLPNELFLDVGGDVLEQFWRQSLTKAVAARTLSSHIWKQNGDEAFIACLLSEIGLLTLVQELGEPYVLFLKKVYAQSEDIVALENESLGFTHHQLTVRLLEQWKLPQQITQSIACINEPEAINQLPPLTQDLAKIVHLAELLTLVTSCNRADLMPELVKYAQQYQQIGIDKLNDIAAGLQQQITQLAEILSVELSQENNTPATIELAHQQLALLAEQVTADVVRAERSRKQAESIAENYPEEAKQLSNVVDDFIDKQEASRADSSVAGRSGEQYIPLEDDTLSMERYSIERDSIGRTSQTETESPNTVTMVDTGVDTTVPQRLGVLLTVCRQTRKPLSLALIEIEIRSEDNRSSNSGAMESGATGHEQKILKALCQRVDHPLSEAIDARTSQIALLLPNCDRPTAVNISQELLTHAHSLSLTSLGIQGACNLSVGVATLNAAPKGFPAEELVESAERSLFAAKSSGGNSVKSINVL